MALRQAINHHKGSVKKSLGGVTQLWIKAQCIPKSRVIRVWKHSMLWCLLELPKRYFPQRWSVALPRLNERSCVSEALQNSLGVMLFKSSILDTVSVFGNLCRHAQEKLRSVWLLNTLKPWLNQMCFYEMRFKMIETHLLLMLPRAGMGWRYLAHAEGGWLGKWHLTAPCSSPQQP